MSHYSVIRHYHVTSQFCDIDLKSLHCIVYLEHNQYPATTWDATPHEKFLDVGTMIVEVATCETFQIFVIRQPEMNRVRISLRGRRDIVRNRRVSERVGAGHFLS